MTTYFSTKKLLTNCVARIDWLKNRFEKATDSTADLDKEEHMISNLEDMKLKQHVTSRLLHGGLSEKWADLSTKEKKRQKSKFDSQWKEISLAVNDPVSDLKDYNNGPRTPSVTSFMEAAADFVRKIKDN